MENKSSNDTELVDSAGKIVDARNQEAKTEKRIRGNTEMTKTLNGSTDSLLTGERKKPKLNPEHNIKTPLTPTLTLSVKELKIHPSDKYSKKRKSVSI